MVLSTIRCNSISHNGTPFDILVSCSPTFHHIDSGFCKMVKKIVSIFKL